MTCAKQRVRCTIVTVDGSVVPGENSCRNPQTTCPRAPGEGYEKCRTICDQRGHAEAVAVSRLNGRTPVKAILEGHTYACDSCRNALLSVGIRTLVIEGKEHDLTGDSCF